MSAGRNSVGAIGIPFGYYNMGYSFYTPQDALNATYPDENATSRDSFYKKLAKSSNSFENQFYNYESSIPYQRLGLNSPGHPLTVDILNPGYEVVPGNLLNGTSPYVKSHTYKTRPFSIIYDSGHIEYDPTDTQEPYKKYYSASESGSYDANNGLVTKAYSTDHFVRYISGAINNPKDEANATYPYGGMKYRGNGVFEFCITIPNIKDYMNDGVMDSNDPDKTTGRRLFMRDCLRLVMFADIKPTENDSMKQTTQSKLKLEIGCNGLGCGFTEANYEDTCPICSSPSEIACDQKSCMLLVDGIGANTLVLPPPCVQSERALCSFLPDIPSCASCLECCYDSTLSFEYAVACSCEGANNVGCNCSGTRFPSVEPECSGNSNECTSYPCGINYAPLPNYCLYGTCNDGIYKYIYKFNPNERVDHAYVNFPPPVIEAISRGARIAAKAMCENGLCSEVNSCVGFECSQGQSCTNFCLSDNGTPTSCQNFTQTYLKTTDAPDFDNIFSLVSTSNYSNVTYRDSPNDACTLSFSGSILKKLYISETEYICVPVDPSDPSAANLENCTDQGAS